MSDQPNSRLPIEQNRQLFQELVQKALDYAKSIGASDAAAELSESQGLSVAVRNHDIETVEQTRDRSLDVTVFAGNQRGSASTSDFSDEAMLKRLSEKERKRIHIRLVRRLTNMLDVHPNGDTFRILETLRLEQIEVLIREIERS